MWLIRERLYLGDHQSGRDALTGYREPVLPGGAPAPFAGVVSLCDLRAVCDFDLGEPQNADTEWLQLPILDGGNGEIEFEHALGVALPFVRRRMRRGNVLVHCAAGMSRSVSVIAALLCDDGADVERAFELIAKLKAGALCIAEADCMSLIAPAPEFQSYLRRRYRKP